MERHVSVAMGTYVLRLPLNFPHFEVPLLLSASPHSALREEREEGRGRREEGGGRREERDGEGRKDKS